MKRIRKILPDLVLAILIIVSLLIALHKPQILLVAQILLCIFFLRIRKIVVDFAEECIIEDFVDRGLLRFAMLVFVLFGAMFVFLFLPDFMLDLL